MILDLGLKGSPTKIAKASDKVRKGAGEKVDLDPTESVAILNWTNSKRNISSNKNKEKW